MLGAIAGDIAGSIYEWSNVKTKDFGLLIPDHAFYTDDTVLTVAVGEAFMDRKDLADTLWRYGRAYPGRGYGGSFHRWLSETNKEPYKSYGNGSAMRTSAAGWWGRNEAEVLELAKRQAEVTHNHPEGVKGAQATSLAIWLGRQELADAPDLGKIRETVARKFGYDLSRTVDRIRPGYRFDVTCQGSVPESLICALEARDFEDAIRNAISIGGDSDTVAAIAGSVAEAIWGVPAGIAVAVEEKLDPALRASVYRFRGLAAQRSEGGEGRGLG